jgi:hypothetical protein
MPSFCRHNRLLQNCPICTKEQNIAMRPVVTRFGDVAPRSAPSRPASPARGARASGSRGRTRAGGMTVRRMARDQDDGFQSGLVPGLKSAAEARRLADEVAFASARCHRLLTDPPGLYAAVADGGADIEQRSWLAFQLAWLSPLDSDDPFAAIAAAHTPWDPETVTAPAAPEFGSALTGPRGTYDLATAGRTAEAYRAWAARAGLQAAAFAGEPSWTPERRFARVYERLALPGVDRAVRFDLLVTLGCTGVYELAAGSLHLGGSDPVTLAAKRILGIGDPLLLERRGAELADAFSAPLQAFDLGLFNWERRERFSGGMPAELELDETVRDAAYAALGLP